MLEVQTLQYLTMKNTTMKNNLSNEDFGEPISTYTKEDAVADGQQVWVGTVAKQKIYFTDNLLFGGFEEEEKRLSLINEGLFALSKQDDEDSEYMKLRVLQKGAVWVVQGLDGIIFMKPEDY